MGELEIGLVCSIDLVLLIDWSLAGFHDGWEWSIHSLFWVKCCSGLILVASRWHHNRRCNLFSFLALIYDIRVKRSKYRCTLHIIWILGCLLILWRRFLLDQIQSLSLLGDSLAKGSWLGTWCYHRICTGLRRLKILAICITFLQALIIDVCPANHIVATRLRLWSIYWGFHHILSIRRLIDH